MTEHGAEEAEDSHWRRRAKPMPRQRTTIRVPLRFPHEAYDRLFRAVLPRAMEDKWVSLPNRAERVVDLHRSWTGFHVYRVHLVHDDEGLAVDRVEVNRDPDQYACTDDAQDARIVAWLLRALVMGEHVPYPVDPSLPGIAGSVAAWASGGRLAIPPPDEPEPEPPPHDAED